MIQIRNHLFLLILLTSLEPGCSPQSRAPQLEPTRSTAAVELHLPNQEDSLKFAAIGDTGTGGREQYEVGQIMEQYHARYPFRFVLLLGDNLYGSEKPNDFVEKFEMPYRGLLNDGVKFYASLGNHDELRQRNYHLFNMNGSAYYGFDKKNALFVALNSNYMDPDQLQWLADELAGSDAEWKIAFFHHPIYSSGKRHGPDLDLRKVLEPIFIEDGVDVVLSGHEHFYERLTPQHGILYFIEGAGAKLRRGNVRPTSQTAAYFDQGRSFLLIEIDEGTLYYQTVSRTGETVDSGRFENRSQETRSQLSRRSLLSPNRGPEAGSAP